MINFEPFAGGTDADPYPTYAHLRETEPVYYNPRYDFFAVSRFSDVQTISRDWTRFSNAQGVDIDRTGDYFGPNFLGSDPPRHRTMRGLVQGRFTSRAVRQTLEPVIRELAAELTEAALCAEEIDLGAGFAWPLPFAIACHLLGFPAADRDFLQDASRTFIERTPGEQLPPPAAQAAAAELRRYVAEIIEERRRRPGDDLVSLLIGAEVDGQPLSEQELIGDIFLLFDAGTQTTGCLLTAALVLLGLHPEQRAWLIEHPERIPAAVEEFLRFESPVQHLTRTASADVELHGRLIPADSTVLLLYGAANRDPAQWQDPDLLDLSREPVRNLAFGDGIHHCIGAPIARLEAAVALEMLLPHLGRLTPTDEPTRLRSHLLRGYVHVPARLR